MRCSLIIVALLLASVTDDSLGSDASIPRLEHGRPDLQGTWVYSDATPLERPANIQTYIIDEQQAMKLDAERAARLDDLSKPAEPSEFFEERSVERVRGQWRSSIVSDTDDGRLPTTDLFKQQAAKLAAGVLTAMDGPEQRPTSERCVASMSAQPPMLSPPGTNFYQFVQTDDTVVIFVEEHHEARVIRMNSRHVPAAVTSWLGDSIGWWEGDTLVVQTKHFTPNDTGRMLPRTILLISPQATVIERFTMLPTGELNYVFTVDDPIYYTRPWSGESQFHRSTARMHEYACHEGNYALTYVLQGAREQEKAQSLSSGDAKPVIGPTTEARNVR